MDGLASKAKKSPENTFSCSDLSAGASYELISCHSKDFPVHVPPVRPNRKKNTTAKLFSGSYSSLEMVGANAMRDRWPPADMTTSYTSRPQAVATRRPWLSYTGAWNTAEARSRY